MRQFILRILQKKKKNDRFPILINIQNSRYNYQTNRLSNFFFFPPANLAPLLFNMAVNARNHHHFFQFPNK